MAPPTAPHATTADRTNASATPEPPPPPPSPPEALDPEVASATEPLSGFAAVWADATFYAEPNVEAPRFSLANFGAAPRRERLGYTVPVTIRRIVGEFVEVTTANAVVPPARVGKPDPHCGWLHLVGPGEVSDVTVFVKRSELAPVLAAPYQASFDDGSSIELMPGTPILRTREGAVAASLALGVPIKGDPPIRYSYRDRPPPANAEGEPAYALTSWNDVTLGGKRFSIGHPLFAPAARSIADAKGAADRSLFPLETRCTVLQVSVPTSALAPYEPWGPGGGGVGVGFGTLGAEHWALPVGTALRTKAGRFVGRLSREVTLEGNDDTCVKLHFRVETWFLDVPTVATDDGFLEACAAKRARVKRQGFGHRVGGLGIRRRENGGGLKVPRSQPHKQPKP
jgi:hypothetical protein